jgi:hypothetical protein
VTKILNEKKMVEKKNLIRLNQFGGAVGKLLMKKILSGR